MFEVQLRVSKSPGLVGYHSTFYMKILRIHLDTAELALISNKNDDCIKKSSLFFLRIYFLARCLVTTATTAVRCQNYGQKLAQPE